MNAFGRFLTRHRRFTVALHHRMHRPHSLTACLVCRAVWAALEADPRIRAALDEGLADLAAGRRIPWDEQR